MECKYDPMQSKSITEVIMGTHAFPFTFVPSAGVSLFIDYIQLYFLHDTVYYWLTIFKAFADIY